MLNGVISHWSALGKTSIAGLRQTFLVRAKVQLLRRRKLAATHTGPRPLTCCLIARCGSFFHDTPASGCERLYTSNGVRKLGKTMNINVNTAALERNRLV